MANLEARIALLEREVARLSRGSRPPFAAARSTLAPVDSGVVQTVQAQLDAFSNRDGIPVLYNFGFFANPPVGADMHVAFLDGDRSQAVVIATGHQTHRPTGNATGDAGLHDAFSHIIHLNSGGITIVGNITLTGSITMTGDLAVTGSITATGGIQAGTGGADSVTLQHHTHSGGSPPTAGT
ncbi:MAG TPA: phage baseplate assembly protein [Chloroflexota bacterium]|jgi:phage gp45-like